MAELAELWEEVVEAEDGSAAEQRVVEWSRAVGRRVLEAGLQAGVERREQATRRCCGRAMIRRVREWRQVATMLDTAGMCQCRSESPHCAG